MGHSLSDYIVVADANRRYIDVSQSVCDLLGYSREEMLTKTIDDISAPSGAHTASMFQRFAETGRMRGWYLLRHRNGHLIEIDYVAEALPDGTFRACWFPRGVREADRRQLPR